MLYIPPDDEEYDNVYMTTEDNIGYKVGFAVNEQKQLLENPVSSYSEPPFTVEMTDGKPSEEIN